MAVQCCERPKLSDFGLNTQDPSVFYRTQWKTFPWIIFVIYRLVIALYILGIFIAYLINQLDFYGGEAFVYLTNLGFIVFFLYVEVAGVIALVDGGILRNRNVEDVGIRHKIQWFFFNITVNINILVTIIYWSFLYSPNFPFFYDFNVHTLTTVVSLIDLFLTAIPVRFLHLIYPLGFGIAYLILTLIYWGAGGMTVRGDSIYPFLDYSDSPGLAVGVIVGVLVAVVVTQGLIWAFYKLRMWIWLSCGSSVTEEDPGKMEEGM